MVRVSGMPPIPLWMFARTAANFALGPFYKKRIAHEAAVRIDGPCLREAVLKRKFHLGAAVSDTEAPSFSRAFQETFTSLTPENALKWGSLRKTLSGPYDFTDADRIVAAAGRVGARVRGHTLVWGKFPGAGFPLDLADVLNNASNPAAALHGIMEEHIFTVMGRYRDSIADWDVVNEPFELFRMRMDDNAFHQVLGFDYIPLSFSLARKAHPSARLFLNEEVYPYRGKRPAELLGLLRRLRDSGAPIDGVGIQSHVITDIPSLKDLKGFLGKLRELDLAVEITELDASIGVFRRERDPFRAQGELFKGIVETCLECPSCTGVTFWGIDGRNNWMDSIPLLIPFAPNSPFLYGRDMQYKPAYRDVRDAFIHP